MFLPTCLFFCRLVFFFVDLPFFLFRYGGSCVGLGTADPLTDDPSSLYCILDSFQKKPKFPPIQICSFLFSIDSKLQTWVKSSQECVFVGGYTCCCWRQLQSSLLYFSFFPANSFLIVRLMEKYGKVSTRLLTSFQPHLLVSFDTLKQLLPTKMYFSVTSA